MGRNSELIRQWTVLQRLATRRTSTIAALSAELKVSTRTIRRDLEALQAAGFPIYDEIIDGSKAWRIDAKKLLDALARRALTLPELCALYYSRALVKAIAGSHMLNDLQSALDKFQAALPPGMKKFLDRLPQIIAAKQQAGRRRTTGAADTVTRLLEASMTQRVVSMRYHSKESGRDKDYTVHPYRLVYAQNAMYLQAFVPAYNELRTFAADRIHRLTVQEQTFDRLAELGSDPFSKSMGVHSGPMERVQLRFAPHLASFIKERTWHDSQQIRDRSDGSVVMTLQVTDDYALRQWILGFGRAVRVLAPATLVEWVAEELDGARLQYESGGAVRVTDSDLQPGLPFLFNQIGTA